MANSNPKPTIPDTDALIDEIIAKKGKFKYKDGMSEDNWEEEIEQIPLFMTEVPEHIDPEKGSGILALQDLKYQEDDPNSRASAYKEDGNELFKKKKYKEAITAYSEGLQQGSTDDQLLAILHCNRAAAHYHIGNMRSSINDAHRAKTLKPDHVKAFIRGAEANNRIEKYGDAIAWCDEGLKVDPTNRQLKELRSKAVQNKKKDDRDKRKRDLLKKEEKIEQEKLYTAIKKRNIHVVKSVEQARGHSDHQNEDEDDVNRTEIELLMNSLTLSGSHPITKTVYINEHDELVWPVIFLYPEYSQSEVVLEFNENSRFIDHIEVMFGAESAPWDLHRSYTPKTIEVWYEDLVSCSYVQVQVDSTLGFVINRSPRFTVVSGTPTFILLVNKSKFKTEFLHSASSG